MRPAYYMVVLVLAAACFGGVPACSGSKEAAPQAALASSTAAGALFTQIREDWGRRTAEGRLQLRRSLTGFLAAYPKDGLAPLARVYLILSLMEPEPDWPRADLLLASTPEPAPGIVHDLYLIAKARSLRRHAQPDQAFDLLRPLVGKMVDDVARGMLEEEVTLDAFEAHHDYEAVAYMDAWLRGVSEEEHDAARAKIAKILEGFSDAVLENSLRSMRDRGSSGYGAEIQRLVAERLGAIAVTKGDPALARWLLDPDAGVAMIGGDAGVVLGELATSKRGIGSVAGRTIGLLLPTGSSDLRDEAADVARGVAWALDLPRSEPKGGDGTRLVTRDDAGDPERMEAGFEELAGEGASIILAGMDEASADRAIEWGERRSIAVVALAAPASKTPGAFTFVVGTPLRAVVTALTAALATRKDLKIAPVVEGEAVQLFTRPYDTKGAFTLLPPVPCDVEAKRAGEPRFPVAFWESEGAHAWLILGPPDCARDVFHEEGTRAKGGTFGLSLEASSATERPKAGRVLAASAGVVPGTSLEVNDPRLVDVHSLTARFGGQPSWWTAVGRDAAMLARRALSSAPTDAVALPKAIAERRGAARDALATAHERLWTTDADGFAGQHVLPRELRIVELSGP